MEWNSEKIKKLISERKNRINQIKNTNTMNITTPYFSADYYKKINNEISENKDLIIKMLTDLHVWLNKTIMNHNMISILGM